MNKIDFTQKQNVLDIYKKIDFSSIRKKYNDAGTRYAFDVLDEKIVTGYLIKLACFRHLRDLQRIGERDFPYIYSEKEANNILTFASICPNVDTGEPTKLMPWQKFILSSMMGWRALDDTKRFTRVLISVARGQGKTYLMSIVEVYSFLIESLGLKNQDSLVSSINFKQTTKLFGYVKDMMKSVIQIEPFKSLAEESGLSNYTIQSDQIIMKNCNNIMRAISHESGQYDSFHFRTAVFDESGELRSREKISKIISGQVKVANKQFIQISTSYPNPSSPFYEDQQKMKHVMEQDWNREADTYLCLVWAQDDLSETFNSEMWNKSNPLLDSKEEHDLLLAGLIDKRDNDMLAGTIEDFQNKNLNMWLRTSTNGFLKLHDIERSVIDDFDIKGRQVYVGFDYSMMSDNTSLAFVFPYNDGSEFKWHVRQHSFIPFQKAGSIAAKEKQDGIYYRELERKGFCTITRHQQGLIINDDVYFWLLRYVEDNELDVVYFGYDAMGVTPFIKLLELNTSWPLNAIRQRTSDLKDATKFLQRLFIESTITRLDDKIMEKALLNAQIYEDSIGIKIDKGAATLKIDAVDAIVDAFYQAMYHFEDFSTVNDRSKMVDRMTQEQVLAWFENKESGLLGGDDIDF